jgi:hypothetical protein
MLKQSKKASLKLKLTKVRVFHLKDWEEKIQSFILEKFYFLKMILEIKGILNAQQDLE